MQKPKAALDPPQSLLKPISPNLRTPPYTSVSYEKRLQLMSQEGKENVLRTEPTNTVSIQLKEINFADLEKKISEFDLKINEPATKLRQPRVSLLQRFNQQNYGTQTCSSNGLVENRRSVDVSFG